MMSTSNSNTFLFVGLTCFDVVTVCEGYPLEDSDTRAVDQAIRRGGNASNSCTCFSNLIKWFQTKYQKEINTKVEFFGTVGGDVSAQFMMDDMNSLGISTEHVVKCPDSISALAVIVVNKETGTRTIIHCIKNLPELKTQDFQDRIDISRYKWIHFEARKSLNDIKKMIQLIRTQDPKRRVTVSVEIEKASETRDAAWVEDVDYFFVSKDYAKIKGASGVEDVLSVLGKMLPVDKKTSTTIIAPWSEMGATAGVFEGGKMMKQVSSKAFTPKNGVVDTTGAGDAFIAATIFSLDILTDRLLEESVTFGCKFAGAKCGTFGNQGIDNFEQFL